MTEETKTLLTIYKQIRKVNKSRFTGDTAFEIVVFLQKITGVDLGYTQEQELIESIKRVRK